MYDMLVIDFATRAGIAIYDKEWTDPVILKRYAEDLENRLLFPEFMPLDWTEEDGVWTALGVHGYLQVDLVDGKYHAQRNDINDDDCDGDEFDSLEEAIKYLEDLHREDMKQVMRFIQWPILY